MSLSKKDIGYLIRHHRLKHHKMNLRKKKTTTTTKIKQKEESPSSSQLEEWETEDLKTTTVDKKTHETLDQKIESLIFVSVASYRDSETAATVEDIFSKAKNPEQIIVGVCDQRDKESEASVKDLLSPNFTYTDSVIVLDMDFRKAQGPNFARYLIYKYCFENLPSFITHYLQIDSHTLFENDWDILLLDQLSRCDSSYPILTCHVPSYNLVNRSKKRNLRPTKSIFSRFNKRTSFPEFGSQYILKNQTLSEPFINTFWSGSFVFCETRFFEDVPIFNHFPFMFRGEDFLMTLVAFTHGWDLFAPSVNVLYHQMDRSYRPNFWELWYKRSPLKNLPPQEIKMRSDAEKDTIDQLTDIFSNGFDPYDDQSIFGNIRSFQDFVSWTGVNFNTQTYTESVQSFQDFQTPLNLTQG